MKWSFFTGWFQIQKEFTIFLKETSLQQQMPSKVFTFIDRQENVMAVRSIAP